MKKLLYLFYYLKQLDKVKYISFLNYASSKHNLRKLKLAFDSFVSVFKYNISMLDYFQFRFYELSPAERLTWAGTGYMYEYQLKMNPKDKRDILDDKRKFYKNYKDFI